MRYDIPFNKPYTTGQELELMQQALANGHISGDGPFTAECERALGAIIGAKRVLLTSSCTDALEMSAILLNLEPGDEVIVPAFTFVSTANAFALHGARPVFADIRSDTLNIDESTLESLITRRTRAIVAVHYAGVGCDMDALRALTEPRGIALIEDNAHGLFGQYKAKPLGSFGAMATQSFHETKNIIAGEGGALVINDPALEERAEIIREKGTNRKRFYRGQVDKYTWVDVGSSFLPSDLTAAFLAAQLRGHDDIQLRRKRIWNRYEQALGEWAAVNAVRLPVIPAEATQSFHMFYLLCPSLEGRERLIAHLRDRSILAVFHYQPLNASEMGQRFGGHAGQCPVTESVADRLLRLPFYNALTEDEQARVIDAIREFRM
jgi:dTDP-4-amino-4,6-dideoxygalactose transaminase